MTVVTGLLWFQPDVREVRIANFSLFIIPEHRIDCLRQLSTTAFIDATRINPYVVVIILRCLGTSGRDLGVPSFGLDLRLPVRMGR